MSLSKLVYLPDIEDILMLILIFMSSQETVILIGYSI